TGVRSRAERRIGQFRWAFSNPGELRDVSDNNWQSPNPVRSRRMRICATDFEGNVLSFWLAVRQSRVRTCRYFEERSAFQSRIFLSIRSFREFAPSTTASLHCMRRLRTKTGNGGFDRWQPRCRKPLSWSRRVIKNSFKAENCFLEMMFVTSTFAPIGMTAPIRILI